MKISGLAELQALEAKGFDAVFAHKSPWDILQHHARERPDAIAIRYLHDPKDLCAEQTLTYSAFAAQIMGAARLFRAHGVTHDRSVALLTQHTPSGQTALWGAQIAGRACPINPMLKPDHIAALIRASDAAVVVAMGMNDEFEYWSSLIPALRREGIDLPIFACDTEEQSPGADGHFEALITAAGEEISPAGDAQAFAAFYHTGGTTGAPKLVQHSRLNEAHVAQSCALMHDLGPDDVVLNGFPLFHVAGAFVFGLSTLSAGGTLVIPGRLGMRNQGFMQSVWQQVERLGITAIGAVPTVLATLKGTPVDADISGLRVLLTGGSPLPSELADAVEQHTGVPVRNILGMTESAGAIAVEPLHAARTPLSCGLRLPFTEVAILGESAGEPDITKILPVGETGIVATRGPNISTGYTDVSKNAGTFLQGGWLASGDLGHLDAQGRLYVTGRKKDLIIRGAHNIDPQMIEDALLAHPMIENAAAVGMPDAYAGELPVAFITTRENWTPEGDALLTFLKERIEDPLALPKRIETIEQMPLTPVGKIFKPTLRGEATRWAVSGAADRLGTSARIEIKDTQAVHIAAPEADLPSLKDTLAGMPITCTFSAI